MTVLVIVTAVVVAAMFGIMVVCGAEMVKDLINWKKD